MVLRNCDRWDPHVTVWPAWLISLRNPGRAGISELRNLLNNIQVIFSKRQKKMCVECSNSPCVNRESPLRCADEGPNRKRDGFGIAQSVANHFVNALLGRRCLRVVGDHSLSLTSAPKSSGLPGAVSFRVLNTPPLSRALY